MSAISGNPNDRRSKNVPRAGIDVVANSKVAVKKPAPSAVAAAAAETVVIQQAVAQAPHRPNMAEKAEVDAAMDQMDDGASELSHKARDKDAKKKGHGMAATLKGLFKPKR